jgi:hypothetical protein
MNRLRAMALGALTAFCMGACLYDPDDVCSSNQELASGQCMCVTGSVPAEDGDGCSPCGPNEVAAGTACACVEGYARASEGEPCEPVPTGLGAACDPAGLPCTEGDYGHCQATAAEAGYCTSTGCDTSDDCPSGYACTDDGAVRFCMRPPTGQGHACASSADCADYEATYCETFVAHICLVSGCSLSPDSCHEGWVCCDLSGYGVDGLDTLCVEEGSCPTS